MDLNIWIEGYMSIEQLISVFWYIVRLTAGFPLKQFAPTPLKNCLTNNRKICITIDFAPPPKNPWKKARLRGRVYIRKFHSETV